MNSIPQTIANAHTKQVTRLVFVGKTGQFLTCSGDQSVKGWNVDNGQTTRTFAGGTLPAAVTWPVKNRPKTCAASMTAR